ncbi:P-loop domain-containing protein [Brevibacterium sediminis]
MATVVVADAYRRKPTLLPSIKRGAYRHTACDGRE